MEISELLLKSAGWDATPDFVLKWVSLPALVCSALLCDAVGEVWQTNFLDPKVLKDADLSGHHFSFQSEGRLKKLQVQDRRESGPYRASPCRKANYPKR